MTRSLGPRAAVGRLLPACCAVMLAAGSLGAQQELQFLVTFSDSARKPLADLDMAEVLMFENKAQGTILQMERVGRPLDVTLVLDNGVGMATALAELRTGARGFFEGLPEGSHMSLVTLAPQPRWVQRPTPNASDVLRAVDRLAPDESLGRFLDALVEYGGRLGRQTETRHPVVVIVGSNAPDGSSSLEQHFRRLAGRLADHSATVHAVVVSTNVRQVGPRLPEGTSSELQRVVGLELSRMTGGRYEQVAVTSRLVTLLPDIAADITAHSQPYRLRARRPAAATGEVGPVGFSTSRPGVVVRSIFVNGPQQPPPPGR